MKNDKQNEEIKKAAALEYNPDEDSAPRLVASGRGEIAEKIIEIARENDIHIEKDQDLVEVLIRLNIGEEIPPELYRAIAEILSFIYRLEDL